MDHVSVPNAGEGRFEGIVQGLDAIVWEADPGTFRFTFVSDRAEAALGYPLEDWYELGFWAEHIHPDDREQAVAACAAATKEGVDHELDYRCLTARGGVRWFRDTVRVETDSAGRPTALRGVMVDVTARRELYEGLSFQAAVLEQVDAGVIACDPDGTIVHWNAAAERQLGWTRKQTLGNHLLDVDPDPELRRVLERLLEQGRAGHPLEGEFELWRSDGSSFWADVRVTPLRDEEGAVSAIVGVCVDVTDRRLARSQLELRMAQQEVTAWLGQRALAGLEVTELMEEATSRVAATLDVEHVVVFESLSDSGELLLRSVGSEVGVGRRHLRFPAGRGTQAGATLEAGEAIVSNDTRNDPRFEADEAAVKQRVASGATVIIGGRGRPFGVLGAYALRRDAFSHEDVSFLSGVANVLAEAIERSRSEEETRHRALHDALTGLPNRALLLDRLTQALAHAKRRSSRVALLFLDVDRFKLVNDSLGHQAGDELLTTLATRLSDVVRPADTVARLGGDEFVVLCEDVADAETAERLADRLNSAFELPFTLSGTEHHATASIGIALPESLDDPPESLISDADAAMYTAKEHGRARLEVFEPSMRPGAARRMQTEQELRLALERDELRLEYQPIVGVEDSRIHGVEALLRWDHPERGLVYPLEFVPLAEESGLIVPLGEWVVSEACRQAVAWGAKPPPAADSLVVGVNVSGHQLARPEFEHTVSAALGDSGLDPAAFALEVTESILLDASETPLNTLSVLGERGTDVVLDDFGTGYSSLAYLNRFPVGTLKVDRSFIARISAGGLPIVDAIVNMGHALGMTVIAEGVETEEQLDALRGLGCDFAQGFCLARPMRPEAFAELLGGSVTCGS